MNFGTMTTTVYRLMRDNLQTKYDFDSIRAWLNEGVRKYCNETGYNIQKDASIDTQIGVQEYPLPDKYKSLVGVYLDEKRLNLIEQTETIEEIVQSGVPQNFYIRNNYIGLYPIPSAVHDLTIIYRSIGDSMTNNSDEPGIPEEHHYIPIWWACYLCAIEGDDARVNHFKELFMTELKASITDIVNKVFPEIDTGITGEEYNHDFNRIM